MGRCLGCTVAEDNYYKSQVVDNNVVRIVVDQPSEILINTNDYVVVKPYSKTSSLSIDNKKG